MRASEIKIQKAISDGLLKPFSTDGPSDFGLHKVITWMSALGFSTKGFSELVQELAHKHDKQHWLGDWSGVTREKSNQQFRDGLAKKYPKLSKVYWLGVAMFSHQALPFPWRWGYGWKYLKAPNE